MAHIVTFTSDSTTAVEFHGSVAVVRHEFSRKADAFYTVRDLTTGRDFSYSFRLLRNARRHAQAIARHQAQGHDVALAALGASR